MERNEESRENSSPEPEGREERKTLIQRYYFIRSDKKANAEEVARDIKAFLLMEKRLESILEHGDVARAVDIHLEEFEINDIKGEPIPAKRKKFLDWRDYGVQFVVTGTKTDIVRMESYLSNKSLEIEVVKELSYREPAGERRNEAVYTFSTCPCHDKIVENYAQRIRNYIKSNYPAVTADISVIQDVNWENINGTICTGLFYGDVRFIESLARVAKAIAEASGCSLKRHSVVEEDSKSKGK